MSIFGNIVGRIFGRAKPNETPPATATPDPVAAAAVGTGTMGDATAQSNADGTQVALGPTASIPPSTPVAPLADVDVGVVMDQLVSESGQKLNWRGSIVDTMKALGIDSSLEHRRQLAQELKYTGNMSDSATMNVWLHKQLMQALAANGGKLPTELA